MGGGIDTEPLIKTIMVQGSKYGRFTSEQGLKGSIRLTNLPEGYTPIAVVEANTNNAWWLLITEAKILQATDGYYLNYYTVNRRTTAGGEGTTPSFKIICMKE